MTHQGPAPDPVPEPDDSSDSPGDAEAVEPEIVEVEEISELEERRYPSTIGGAFYLVVLGLAGFGIVVAWREDWRLGVQLVAAALGLAAVTRLVLPAKDAGMLAVRHRVFDVVLLAALGGLLVFLVQTIPDQRL